MIHKKTSSFDHFQENPLLDLGQASKIQCQTMIRALLINFASFQVGYLLVSIR